MARHRLGPTLLGAVLLAGCQPDSASTRPATRLEVPNQPAFSVSFRCPPAGTTVHSLGRGTVRYAGSDPTDVTICLVRTLTGQQRWLYNVYMLPADDERSLRPGLQRLWPLEPGKTSNFTFTGRTRNNETYRYAERWRVLRMEFIPVGRESRRTVVVERTQEGMLGNTFLGTETYWLDVETGADLKRTVSVIRGSSTSGPYEATSIVRM